MFKNDIFDPKNPTNRYTFEIYDIDLAIVNAFRRIILSEIEIPGMIGENEPTVEIISSNGPLHNEILTHRIGLIPICLKENEVDNYIDNSITLELNVNNTTNTMKNVTTEDIIVKRNDKEIDKKELREIFYPNMVTNNYILITRLRENEYLHFKGSVVKKNSKYNAAFNPVSLCTFSNIIDKSKITKDMSILDKEREYYVNKYGDPNAFQFEIEPINKYLTPKYLINKSIEILINKINNLLSNIRSSNEVELLKVLENTYKFIIQNEDDTLGNVIQSFIHDKYVRNNDTIMENISCKYCGYICPHPLKNLLEIQITLENQTDEGIFKDFLQTNCLLIIDKLQDIKTEWNIFVEKK
jgi:DNA-directed RNA polymerase subunit L/DNA-directed RNA polymerase alpha subunit